MGKISRVLVVCCYEMVCAFLFLDKEMVSGCHWLSNLLADIVETFWFMVECNV
jgi:hypothetical protein